MKSLTILLPAIAFLMISCSSSKTASTAYDDVYYTSSKQSKGTIKATSKPATYTSKEVYSNTSSEPRFSDADGGTLEEGYYEEDFDMDDYYDYEYTARIKRFHQDNPEMGYYDEYYTDTYYYTEDPNTYGTSIYQGYAYPASSVSVSVGFGVGMGVGFGVGYGWGYPYYRYGWPYYDNWWPYYSWGWPYYGWGYGYPYYGYGCGWGCGWPYYGWGYNSYWAGYWHGYWDGYYGYPTPYAYYGNSYYGGQRGSRGLNTNGTGGRGINVRNANLKDVEPGTNAYARTSRGGDVAPITPTAKTNNTNTAPQARTARESITKEPHTTQARLSKPTEVQPRTSGSTAREPQERKYERPNATTTPEKRYSKPRTYQAPEHRTARSSQEYSNPRALPQRSYNSRPSGGDDGSQNARTQSGRIYRSPAQNNTGQSPDRSGSRTYSTPTQPSPRTVTSPSRTNTNVSTPSRSTPRSYSTPSRSPSRSISSPSRSSSVASPSRSVSRSSGGSSGGSSSGGGSRSGGRR